MSARFSVYRLIPQRRYLESFNDREEALRFAREQTDTQPERFEVYDNQKLKWIYAAQRPKWGKLTEEYERDVDTSRQDDIDMHCQGYHDETKLFGCPECYPDTSGSDSAIRARRGEV